jgi:hypothetical protein
MARKNTEWQGRNQHGQGLQTGFKRVACMKKQEYACFTHAFIVLHTVLFARITT